MNRSVERTFLNGQSSRILTIPEGMSYEAALADIGLLSPCPTLAIIGGAANMSTDGEDQLTQFFTGVLAPMAERYGITVFDGGTNTGVIQKMGIARNHINGQFNLVGIAPQCKVQLPGDRSADPTDVPGALKSLESNHTHFLLVPGQDWGSESAWMAQFASSLAGRCPSITLLINGGKVSLIDLQMNLSLHRKVIVLSGSGRLADEIAMTVDGRAPSSNTVIHDLIKNYFPTKLSLMHLSSPLERLTQKLQQFFNNHD